jgi:hypothetical protein
VTGPDLAKIVDKITRLVKRNSHDEAEAEMFIDMLGINEPDLDERHVPLPHGFDDQVKRAQRKRQNLKRQ